MGLYSIFMATSEVGRMFVSQLTPQNFRLVTCLRLHAGKWQNQLSQRLAPYPARTSRIGETQPPSPGPLLCPIPLTPFLE